MSNFQNKKSSNNMGNKTIVLIIMYLVETGHQKKIPYILYRVIENKRVNVTIEIIITV